MDFTMHGYIRSIRQTLSRDYKQMYRPPGQRMKYPFLTPGSEQYADVLWDWDSWLSNVALRQILVETGTEDDREEAKPYERGCVQNFIQWSRDYGHDGWVPISVRRDGSPVIKPDDFADHNMHKPCLAQHAAFLSQQDNDVAWLGDDQKYLQFFVNCYRNHFRHACGLYFWQDDRSIGVDNDPCTFDRPPRSSGSIYLNCLMYRELLALSWILDRMGLDEVAASYRRDSDHLREAIQAHCWDERDGFFYSVDFNLLPVESGSRGRHPGQPRNYPCLLQRIGVWSGFMALWAGVATPEQAARVVQDHYRDPRTFGAPFGVRTLSKMEKMYNLRASGNPSSWLGPLWGIANYMSFRGFVRYGQDEAARDLCEKTIKLFGQDLEKTGALHEYYQPENGEPILNWGFQNWNYLVLNMIAWLEGRQVIEEF
ncbi:MAG: glycoside hydrolase family 37 [Candidatus Marinimicrobia bacterium]|nr:glycoside hydrolase family 37 [Candidatus Neomarinimicrobiota bacterium]